MSVVNYKIIESIGIISIANPPVNALSHAVREGISQAIERAQSDETTALIIICEGRTFIAGADITEFGKPHREPFLPDMIDAIERSNKLVVAAIHGTALGGGLETALGCHYRCALASAKVGLPEVKLGLLPGAGGTQRLPRLAGVAAALEMIMSGQPVSASQAQEFSLIDRVVEGDLLTEAMAYTQELVAQEAPLRRASDRVITASESIQGLLDTYRYKLDKKSPQLLAPRHILSCIKAAVELPFAAGALKERELFIDCMQSSQSSALRHLFFAERKAAQVSGLSKEIAAKPIRSVAVIGGGTMGTGIAMSFANAGIGVTLLDVDAKVLQRGLAIIDKNYSASIKRGKISEAQRHQSQSLIASTTDYRDIADVDLVVEAVFENLEIKKEVFAKLDQVCKPGAILATNTSYQDINQIAQATSRPEAVLGMHFFSPAHVMKLLEVVRADKTADEVIVTAMKLAKTIKKIAVLAGVCYGFIGNRMLTQYVRQSQLCLIEGASPEQVDGAMERWGMAMGPLAVADLVGLDVSYRARQGLTAEQKGDQKTYCIADALVERERLGQKTAAGYYRYDPASRSRINDSEVMEIIEAQSHKQAVVRRAISDEEIVNRLIFPLINEGAKILEEGIAQRPGDIDIVYVYGYGFPAHLGGPMQYANEIGLKKVYETICDFHSQFGDNYWQPASLLKELAQAGKQFSG